MGCFPCFDSKEEEELHAKNVRDDRREGKPVVESHISRLSSGADRQRMRSVIGSRKESLDRKDVPDLSIAAQTFTFRELAAATRNFRPECLLGEGGFGRVYKGRLESTGQVVAVKQLDRDGLQGNREFLVEVLMLSLLHHPNLVNLIGYCADGDQRLLVYEFLPLGSLEDHLHGRRSQDLAIIVYDPEIERTFRRLRRQAQRARSNTHPSSDSELEEISVNRNQDPEGKMAGREEEEVIMNNQKRPMKESYIPLHTEQPSTILYPPNTAANFTLHAQLLNMVPHYHGLPNEDPYLHIKEFFELCATQQIQGVTAEGIRLRLFPFSLKDKAKIWLNSLDAGSINSWQQLASKFLKKFFPAQKTRQLRREIQTFQQKDGDQFWEAWEHFKDLLLKCPHHNLTKDDQVQAFYEGLNELNKGIVDSVCGGALMEKNSEEAYDLFETLSENSQQFSCRNKQMGKKQGMYEIQSQGNIAAQMAAMDKKMDMLIKAMASNNMQGQTPKEVCAICSHTNHATESCPMSSFTDQEHTNYVGNTYPKQNNPYSNTYNSGWRNHPNFSWGGHQNNQGNQGNQSQYQGQQRSYQNNNFSQNSAPNPPEDEFKSLVTQFIQSSQANLQQHSQAITNTQQSLAKLEAQVGQIANALSKREDGAYQVFGAVAGEVAQIFARKR